MQISFTGRQMEIPPVLRQYTERRLRKLSRLVRDGSGSDVHVILTAEKHRRTAEIPLRSATTPWWGWKKPPTRGPPSMVRSAS